MNQVKFIKYLFIFFCLFSLVGCQLFSVASVVKQIEEEQTVLDVSSQYDGLKNNTVGFLLNVDLGIHYEDPLFRTQVSEGIAKRITQVVDGVKVLDPRAIVNWQDRNSQWPLMGMQEIIVQLKSIFGKCNRLVIVDVQEYRLNPRGNRYLWEGICRAFVKVAEEDSDQISSFVEVFEINSKFPETRNVTREEASGNQIRQGLISRFIRDVSWLFYRHAEWKYPERHQDQSPPQILLER